MKIDTNTLMIIALIALVGIYYFMYMDGKGHNLTYEYQGDNSVPPVDESDPAPTPPAEITLRPGPGNILGGRPAARGSSISVPYLGFAGRYGN